MKHLSLLQFKDLINNIKYEKIVLTSENQNVERHLDNSSQFCFYFNSIEIYCISFHNYVTLKGNDNKITLNKVKQVKYTKTLIGYAVTFVCEKFIDNRDTEYTLLFCC